MIEIPDTIDQYFLVTYIPDPAYVVDPSEQGEPRHVGGTGSFLLGYLLPSDTILSVEEG